MTAIIDRLYQARHQAGKSRQSLTLFLLTLFLLVMPSIFLCPVALATPLRPLSQLDLGISAYQGRHWQTALLYLQQALRQDRNNPTVHYYLGNTYAKLAKSMDARQEYLAVIQLSPGSTAAKLSQLGLYQLSNPDNSSVSRVLNNDKTVLTDKTLESIATEPSQPDTLPSAEDPRKTDRFGFPVQTPNYLDETLENGRQVRWSTFNRAITLYIEPAPQGVKNFQPAFISNVKQAMAVWFQALDNRFNLKLVSTPEQAMIRVNWVNGIDTVGHSSEKGTSYTAGLTLPSIRNDRLEHMDVRISTFDILQKPQTPAIISAVAVHELGHALGILGHSRNPADIMFAQQTPRTQLSKGDVNTIRALYSIMPDVTDKTRSGLPQNTKVIGQRIQASIDKQRILAENGGSNLDWLNLGTLYLNQAKFLRRGQALQSEIDTYLDKALAANNEAIKREPKDSIAFFNQSLIWTEKQKLTQALGTIEQAIKLNPDDGRFYQQKATLLVNLRKKAEATSAINEWLIRDPSARSSPDLQELKIRLQAL
ncbi:MAG: tetratricopeptide repeat protein [Cyanobacteria bacterium]|nr:tetratricopeptide repeat protein [Cyanobacteriota bacterium]